MSDFQFFDSEFIEVFREEFTQYVRQLDDLLLRVQRKPDDEKLIDELRRILHTIKGMFGTIGQTKLQEITHALEDAVLATPTTGISQKTLENLNQFLNILREVMQVMLSSQSLEFDAEPLLSSFASTEELWVKISRKFKITVFFEPNTPMITARALVILRNLKTIAQITKSTPSEVELDSDEAGYFDEMTIEISTFEDEERIEQLLSALPAVKRVLIQPVVIDADVTIPIERTTVPREMQTITVQLKDMQSLSNMLGEIVSAGHVIEGIVARVEKLSEEEQQVISNFRKYILDMEAMLTRLRLVPFRTITRVLPRVANDLAKELGKDVRIYLSGEDIGIDRGVVESLLEPITQLVKNAIVHGIEEPNERKQLGKSMSGAIFIRASYLEGAVEIEVTDDGRGIDLEQVINRAREQGLIDSSLDPNTITLNDVLFLPGFTTKTTATTVAGRGYGLNAIEDAIKRIGGTISVESLPGQGTTFRIIVPISSSIIRSIIFKVKDMLLAIPTSEVETIRLVNISELDTTNPLIPEIQKSKNPFISALYHQEDGMDAFYPVIDFPNILKSSINKNITINDGDEGINDLKAKTDDQDQDPLMLELQKPLILWKRPPNQYAILVDELVDAQELHIKPLDHHAARLPFINGAATYGTLETVFIIDPSKIDTNT